MNKKANLGIIILLVVFLILIIIFVVLFIYSKPVENVEQNLTINKTYYDIYVHSNALTQINYVLSNGTMELVRGTLHDPSIIEEFKNVEKNSTVYMYGWSDEYYYNLTSCIVEFNNSHCVLHMDKKALGYYLIVSKNAVSIFGVDGKIKDPILCFAWRTNIADVITDLKYVRVPDDMHNFVDKCYKMDDIVGNMLIPINVRMNFAYNTSMSLDVYLIDQEKVGYSPIGMKNASVVI